MIFIKNLLFTATCGKIYEIDFNKLEYNKYMRIGLLGCGVVGSGVYDIITENLSPLVHDFEIAKALVKTPKEIVRPDMTNNADDIFLDESIDTVVEAMGGIHPAYEFITRALKAGKNVVTANKAVVAKYLNEFTELAKANGVKLMYEASVGGGVTWIKSMRQAMRIDEITHIGGIFNGTTNLILSEMEEKDLGFDECVKIAQKMGYAEADPTVDVDGIDVRNKLIISTSIAVGKQVLAEEIMTYGIRTVSECDLEHFKRLGKNIRLYAEAVIENGKYCCRIEPCLFDKDEPESSIKLNYNICSLYGKTIGTLKYIGQGAGKFPTANAIVQDLLDINYKNDALPELDFNGDAVCDMAKLEGCYYVRYNEIIAAQIEKAFADVDVTPVEVNGAKAFVTSMIPTIVLHDKLESVQDSSKYVFVARV